MKTLTLEEYVEFAQWLGDTKPDHFQLGYWLIKVKGRNLNEYV